MSIFGISELSSEVYKLQLAIDRLSEKMDARLPPRPPSAADRAQYAQAMAMPDWLNPNGPYSQFSEPKVSISQSEFDKMNAELKGAQSAKLEMASLTHSLRAERDSARQEVTTLQLDAKIKQEQNLRLANRVNDLELQLKAALDGKANDTGAQDRSGPRVRPASDVGEAGGSSGEEQR